MWPGIPELYENTCAESTGDVQHHTRTQQEDHTRKSEVREGRGGGEGRGGEGRGGEI